jgi:hypothetical protein
MSDSDFKVEDISPTKAFEYLQTSGGNRDLKKHLIARYTMLMKSGRWPIGDGVIIFNKDGNLRQGHHRLTAVIASGCTIKFMVRRNADNSEDIVYDTGAIRTPSDAKAFDPETFQNCEKAYFPIVRMLITDGYCRHDRDTSSVTLAEWIDRHKAELEFVWRDCFKEKKGAPSGVAQSAVLSVVVSMAMHGEDRTRLKIIADYLLTGDTTLIKDHKGYQCLTKLRDYLLGTKTNPNNRGSNCGGGSARLDVFSKTQNMLYWYMRGEDRDQVRRCKAQLPYPCLDFINLPKLEIDPQFQYYLGLIAKDFNLNEKISAKMIADRLLKKGYKAPGAKNPVNTVSKRISTVVRSRPSLILSLGDFKLVGTRADQGDRVTGYYFVGKDDTETKDSDESFDEREFLEQARKTT